MPGTLPMTALPAMNFSFAASHIFGWPGAAVYGNGFECR